MAKKGKVAHEIYIYRKDKGWLVMVDCYDGPKYQYAFSTFNQVLKFLVKQK